MKRILTACLVAIVLSYVFYQNGALLILATLSLDADAKKVPADQIIAAQSTPESLKPPFKDGTFIGKVTNAYYGDFQVAAVISNGLIADIQFLKYPNDRTRSTATNKLAMPKLKAEAIQSQSARVDIVTGATDSSIAFMQSLYSALSQAK